MDGIAYPLSYWFTPLNSFVAIASEEPFRKLRLITVLYIFKLLSAEILIEQTKPTT